MRRTGISRKTPARQPTGRQWTGDALPTPRTPALRIADGKARMSVPIAKEGAIQHAGYMAAVRGLACARCGYSAKRSQFCHADEGKGTGLKTDCRRGWPGCGPHDGEPGCHWIVGTSGRIAKADRREYEAGAGARTRAKIIAAGLWPARLPMWVDS